MVIVRVIGGMGNQMFQYAFYLALKKNNKTVKLDVSELDEYLKGFDRSSIFNVFSLDYDKASEFEIKKFRCISFWDRLRNKTNVFPKQKYIKEVCEGGYDSSVFEKDDVYFDGYWQSYKYFVFIREKILESFSFPELNNKNLIYKKQIVESSYPVSVHIRLGDYLNSNNISLFGNICTEDYYSKAINFVKNKHNNATFFLFSNEPNAAKKILNKLHIDNVISVDCNDERNGWIDMYLMSLCKCNIIANSTFSWWAAWLNNQSDKFVIAPKKWLNTKEMPDICPREWIRL